MTLARLLEAQAEGLAACVHCGFCLPACPTYTRLGDEADSPRGRLHLMRAVVEGRLSPSEAAFQEHIDRCLGCRACETVCPSGVGYGRLLEQARAVAAAARPRPLPSRLMLGVFRRPGALAAAMAGARAVRRVLRPGLVRRLPGGRRGRGPWSSVRFGLLMLAASRGARRRTGGGGVREGGAAVALLRGCVQEGLFRRVNEATARVLAVHGYRVVEAPGQGCCGALHAHGGDLEGARKLARRNVRAFEASGAELVVVNAAGCGAVMKEYGALLGDDPGYRERARSLAARVRDVSEVLAARGPRRGGRLPLRVTYDAPCHLAHAQGVREEPVAVLRAVPDLELIPLPRAEECCGGAGVYGLVHPELGGAILGDKLEAIRSTGAEVVATPNPGCMLQIGAGVLAAGDRVRVVHPVELLDESYARAGLYGPEGADPAPEASGGGGRR